MRSELSLDLSSPSGMSLESRMAEFKRDPQKMDEMTKFVDDVLCKAQDEADKKRQEANKADGRKNSREGINNIFTGLKRGRMVTRARGMVLRLFEAICNCTNTGPIPTPRTTSSSKQ